jgi:MFS family permease
MVLAAQSMVASLGRGKSLEKYFGWYTTFVSVGQLVGPLLAGWLIDFRGMELSFRVMLALSLVGLASGFFLVGGARRAQKTAGESILYRSQIRLLTSNSGIQLSLAVTVAVVFALGAVTNFLPVYLESLELTATTIGALLSFRALCSVSVRPFTPLIVDLARGRPRAMIFSVASVGLGLMFTGTTSSVFLLGGLMALIGVGCGVSQPLSMVVLAEHAPSAQRASAFGLRLTANRSVQFLAPLLVGFLAGHTNFGVAFLVAGLVVSASLIVITRLGRKPPATTPS